MMTEAKGCKWNLTAYLKNFSLLKSSRIYPTQKDNSIGGEEFMRDEIEKPVKEHQQVIKEMNLACGNQIDALGKALIDTLKKGNKILVFGNGGSAADAQHLACELVGTFQEKTRRALPAIALTTNASSLTSISNDFSYDAVFKRQIEALAQPGDLCLGISTSGNAGNVYEGLKYARERGLAAVALLGSGGGKAKDVANLAVIVPSKSTPRIQEAHILIIHILCAMIDETFSRD